MDGWLLDTTDAPDGRSILLWVKERATQRVHPRSVPFRPPFFVGAPRSERRALARSLAERPEVEKVELSTERSSLFDRRPRVLLAVTPVSNRYRRALAQSIDRQGEFHRFTLFDVDLTVPQTYQLLHDLYPFAAVTGEGSDLRTTTPAESLEYEVPPLSIAPLRVELESGQRWDVPGARVASVRAGPVEIEGNDEAELLRTLASEVARLDPDVVLTDGGDAFDLPVLYRAAARNGFSDAEFVLGRSAGRFRAARPSRSYMSYGRILHSAAAFDLPGRFHVDRDNSFLFRDTELPGLIDASRLSRLSLQAVVRQSPGTCFSAMEVAEAVRSGLRVPWKKNRPERFRSAEHLVHADRGGSILRPPVGLFDRLDEFDFASLFPQIMVRHNLSAETLDCACCPKSPHVAPEIGYRSCTRHVGLLPRTLGPLLERRRALKAALRRPGLSPTERERVRGRVKMLKWILVTAFGYQGYRNARFGRIEVHEAINAYARQLFGDLIQDAEAWGYRAVHGIVDSIWLAPSAATRSPEEFAQHVGMRYGLPLGYEGRYRWIVFLPAVGDGLGVPNRYYGCYENGEFKLRGIGARRHDTTGLARRLEGELLSLFARARDAEGFRALLPRALARADRFAERVKDGSWPVEELVIRRRTTAPVDHYRVFTETVSALRQSEALGLAREPGESVRYVVLDRSSRAWDGRVRLAEALRGNETYDTVAYLEILAREVESLLAPLGVERRALLARWGAGPIPPRSRYGSPGHRAQRRLDSTRDGGALYAPSS